MDPNPVQFLQLVPSLGSTALLLYVWLVTNKDRAAKDLVDREERAATRKEFLDKLGAIEVSHREEERADREQNRQLFDRVIAICSDLSKAVSTLDGGVRSLSDATKANERAITELRDEMAMLRHSGDRHSAEADVRHAEQQARPRRRLPPTQGPAESGPQLS